MTDKVSPRNSSAERNVLEVNPENPFKNTIIRRVYSADDDSLRKNIFLGRK